MTMPTLRRRTAALAAGLLSTVLVLAACGSGAEETTEDSTEDTASSQTREFEADNGTVEIPTDPQRIVALGNAVGPAIDLGVSPVGVSQSIFVDDAGSWFSAEQLAAYDSAEVVGGGQGELDIEAIAALEPDLILVAYPAQAMETSWVPLQEQFEAIAPTVFIQNTPEWKTQEGRIADAIGKSDAYESFVQEYDALVEDMKAEFSSEIDSLTFAVLNRYANTPEGQLVLASAGTYMARSLTEVGFEVAECTDCELSMEQLSGLADHDLLVYPLGPDGEPTVDFAPVIESNVWQSLPQVVDEHALGLESPSGLLVVNQGIGTLISLGEALRGLPD